MEIEEIIFLTIVGFILINSVILPPLIKIKQNVIITYLKICPFIYNDVTIIVFLTLISELLIYFIYIKVSSEIQEKKEIESKIDEELNQIKEFLNIDIKSLDYPRLLNSYRKFKNPKFSYISILDYQEKINTKFKRIGNRLMELEHKQELKKIENEKENAKQELERINYEIYLKELKDKEKRKKIIERLNIGYKEVFKKENLNLKEREIAKQEGYHAINEYCVLENKLIPVLVKPTLNHSPTHTFLVWSVKKLLKKFLKIERIIEHETRDADISFKIKNKTYAIEIEKGSLLRKKRQLKEKIEFLDDVYRDKWLILVSNKNLVKKYKEFGNVSTRKDLRKKIEKWVKES